MTWSTIRRATDKDREDLMLAAERFCQRHNIVTHIDDTLLSLESELDREEQDCRAYGGRRRLRSAWLRVVRRVLQSRNAEGIAYGHVGFSVE